MEIVHQKRRGFFVLAGAAAVLLAVVLLGACGGNDDEGAAFGGGSVVCEPLASESYKYSVRILFDVQHTTATPNESVSPGPPTARLEQAIEGQVDGQDSSAVINNYDGPNLTTYGAVVADDRRFLQTPQGWREYDEGTREYDPIPYRPLNICLGLAPDVDVSTLEGQSDEVNGIASTRYDVTDFRSDFPDRTADFGGGSDVARLVDTFDGSIWVSKDGGYVTKFELAGDGVYPDGSTLHFEASYELKDMGKAVDIHPPI